MKSRYLCCLLSLGPLFGQSAGPTFEVASVKLARLEPSGHIGSTEVCASPGGGPRGVHGGPGTHDPERVTAPRISLGEMLAFAYQVHTFQVIGPDWVNPPRERFCGNPRYDVNAIVPTGAVKDDVRLMWQSLLRERFGVALHHERRSMQGYTLVVAKGGVKLTPAKTGEDEEPSDPHDPCGLPDIPTMGVRMTRGPNGMAQCIVGRAQTVDQLAAFVEQGQFHPIVDRTGLTGLYDIAIPWPLRETMADSLYSVGLEVVQKKIDVDVLVIDKANRTPTPN